PRALRRRAYRGVRDGDHAGRRRGGRRAGGRPGRLPRLARRAVEVVRIGLLNGPNLNLLGRREPALYGTTTLAAIEARIAEVGAELGVTVECSQHNGEGQLVDAIQALDGVVDGAII